VSEWAMSVFAVSAVIRRGDDVVLVRQQSSYDPEPVWVLPSGMVEAGELADQALVREVWEETGLKVAAAPRLVSVVQFRNPEAPPPGMLTAFYFEAEAAQGDLVCADPDGDVLEVAWVPVEEAIRRLGELQFAHRREPAVHVLRHRGVSMWTWPDGLDGEPVMVQA
jgi:8-oxo-dGTP diphosphatase